MNPTTLQALGARVDRLVREISITGSQVTNAEVIAAQAAYTRGSARIEHAKYVCRECGGGAFGGAGVCGPCQRSI